MDTVTNENYKDEEKNKLKDEEENAANAEGSEFDDSKAKFINGGKGLEDTQVVVEVRSKDDSFTGLGKEELMEYANDPFWVRTRIILFILFWVGWIAMLAAAIIIIVLAPRCPHRPDQKWWNKEVMYQVYPRSFKDASPEPQDGNGDLKGIAEKFDYFNNLTANVIWINPIFESDFLDSGYDVTNHKNISATFGTEAEFREMLRILHKKGKKVVLDFIPNHTSKNHTWFQKSQAKEGKYTNYYMWVPGTQGQPPNNWKSVHGGSAWAYDDVRKEFYLHQYLDMEPDLNLTNPDVLEEMDAIMKYWLDMGVDGFHVVGAPYLVENENVTKNEGAGKITGDLTAYDSVDHSLTAHQPGSHDLLSHFRKIVDSYVKKPGTERLLFATVKGPANVTLPYLDSPERKGVHYVLNQALVNLMPKCDGECIHKIVNGQLKDQPQDAWTGWTLGNEDSHRFASQVGAVYLKAAHTLQMLLPGTASVYYGDEIGLLDAPVFFNATQDPLGKAAGEATYQTVSRDAYRTPMRWNGEEKAGFTEGTPWLPIENIASQPNVKAQKAVFGGYTTLEYFWELAKIRKKPSFQWGKLTYSVVDKDVFSFIRLADGFPGFLVAINFGENKAVRTFTMEGGKMPEEGTVVVHSRGLGGEYSGTHKLRDQPITLQPGDAFVFQI